MEKVTLIQSGNSGIFVLPDGITFSQVTNLYSDGFRIIPYNFKVLDDNVSVDIQTYHPAQHEVITADIRGE